MSRSFPDHGGIAQGIQSAFPKAEYDGRIVAARELLARAGIDVLIVTGPENIFYLTGQQTPGYFMFQALLLPVDGEPAFIIRQLEYFNFTANTFIANPVIYQDSDQPVKVLVDVIAARGWASRRVAIDKRGWFMPIATFEALQSEIGPIGDGAGIIEQLRMVKSVAEIEKIVQAAAYVDAGLRAGLAAVKVGANDNDLAAAMAGAAIAAGSEYVGMEPLVSSGWRSGMPHATWRREPLAKGDPIFLEMAASHDRYHAALLRCAWLGAMPQAAIEMEKTSQEALQAALDAIRPGASCEAPHAACLGVIDRAGYGENFRKRAGYSMGIAFAPDWGEGGVLSLYTGVTTVLRPGMAFHIPVALRVFGRFTVGVSETVIVTQTGYRSLSKIDRPILRIA